MNTAANLLAPASYPDRFAMFAALSDHVDHLHLLVDHLPPQLAPLAARHPNLHITPLGPHRFARRAADWLHPRMPHLDIVHDTFGHLTEIFEAHHQNPHRRARLLTTLYTSNPAWFTRIRHRHHDLGRRYVAQRIIALWRDLRICPAADRIIVLGPGHETDLHPLGIPPDRITWLPSETDTDTYRPPTTPRPPAPHPPSGPRLLYTGTLWRNKGIDLLLDITPALAQTHPGLQLHLIGNTVPWERPWLAQATTHHPLGPALHLPGRLPREALITAYQQADLYLFPSHFEGSPRALREAIACGCRAIASDIPGCRGIDPPARFLRFAPPDDRPAWTQAITDLLTEPPPAAATRIAQGIQHLRTHHHPTAVAARYAALYQELTTAPPTTTR